MPQIDVAPDRVAELGATWTESLDLLGNVEYRITRITEDENGRAGDLFRVTATAELRIPWFSPLLWPVMRATMRQRCRQWIRGNPGRTWWAPPAPIDPTTAARLAVLAFTVLVTTYMGTLFTQTAGYFSDSYGITSSGLKVIAAITRIGTLLALAGSMMADRTGRRRGLLIAFAGLCVTSGLSAVAPDTASFTALQTLTRGFVNLSAGLAGVALIEEAPEGTRAWVMAVSTIIAGMGHTIAVALLPIADIHPEAWRSLFVVAGAFAFTIRQVARSLPESHRFEELMRRRAHTGDVGEILYGRYGSRFGLLVVAVFLLQVGWAPTSQVMNDYLRDTRGMNATAIFFLRAVTQGPIMVPIVYLGGRLTESRGRKPLSIWGTGVGAIAMSAFYVTGGPAMWIALLIATAFAAVSSAAWSVLTTEVFPTEVRGSSTGWLLVAGVTGAFTGLGLAAALENATGSSGQATAIVGLVPVAACVFCLPFLPEGKGRQLDEISPPLV